MTSHLVHVRRASPTLLLQHKLSGDENEQGTGKIDFHAVTSVLYGRYKGGMAANTRGSSKKSGHQGAVPLAICTIIYGTIQLRIPRTDSQK